MRREDSYMIIIPEDENEIRNPKAFTENMEKCDAIEIEETGWNEERGVEIDLRIDGRPYRIWVAPTGIEIPSFVRLGHQFTEEELQRIDATKNGLSMTMIYEGDSRICFHDQLRIIDAMIPEKLAVMDCPSEKLLSGKWVALAAKSKVMPAPRYLFTVQAVSSENGEVWLHTHGMKRCGMYELEILCSTQDMYSDHYHIIETMAYRMLESEKEIKKGEGVFVAQLDRNNYLVTTAIDWKEALPFYPQATMGTAEEREEDMVHGEDTCVVMAYRSQKDEDLRRFTRVQEYDKLLKGNPMFMVSNSETARMSRLAQERVEFMVKGMQDPENVVLAKIGLMTDKKYWEQDEEGTKKEHIWFEVKEIHGDTLTAVLTQEPYYVANMKEGDMGTYSFTDITDWIVFTKKCRITPDDAYLL